MVAEMATGERRASEEGCVCISGWRHLHALAGMEGRLMVMAAASRVRGYLTESERTEIAFTGIEFVRAGYSVRPSLQMRFAMLAARVEQLALQLDGGEWIWAVDYESGAWQMAQGNENAAENIVFAGIAYRPVPHRSNAVGAGVYV